MKKIFFLIFHFISVSTFACPFESANFSSLGQSDVKEKDFNFIAEAIRKIYVPKLKEQKENFDVIANWNSPQINASAEVDEEGRLVLLHGGLARLKGMTFDAFLLVACHEVGHHLGGAPYATENGSSRSWMSSAEGQADYFATLKCYKEVLQKNPEILSRSMKMNLPPETFELCKKQYPSERDYQICLRGSQAAIDYGRTYALRNYPYDKIKISLTDSAPGVQETDLYHTKPQCRTETLYQGILCNKDINIPLSFTDENQGLCSSQNSDKIGLRPKCWYVSK